MKIDRQKELIGYLKVILSLLTAIVVGIAGWLYQHMGDMNLRLILPAILDVFLLFVIIKIHKQILKLIDELEEL